MWQTRTGKILKFFSILGSHAAAHTALNVGSHTASHTAAHTALLNVTHSITCSVTYNETQCSFWHNKNWISDLLNAVYNVFVEPVVLEIRAVKVEQSKEKPGLLRKLGLFYRSTLMARISFAKKGYKPRLKALLSSFNKPDFQEMWHSIITMFVAFEKKVDTLVKGKKGKQGRQKVKKSGGASANRP